jgi:L-amino acid N-acyltransferase YncA
MNDKVDYPRRVRCKGTEIELRLMSTADQAAVVDFASELPVHDVLFLKRDIRNPKVVAAWLESIERGTIASVLALLDGEVVGCNAVVRDALSWSPHVAEVRVVVSADMRGSGLGRLLVQEACALAVSHGAEKIIAHMTPDQRGALALFEDLGFRAEALLRDHVRDADSVTHDLAILSLEVSRLGAQFAAFGHREAF